LARRVCGEEHYPSPLLAAAGYGLPGASRTFPDRPLNAESWAAVLRAATAHRLTGPLRAAVDAGALPATEEQQRAARAAQIAAAARVLRLEQALVELVDQLDAAGIATRVLKGSAVAHLDYAQPALRSFIDLDVMVRPADFDRTVRVLTTTGFVRRLAEPRPGFDVRFDKGTTLVSPGGYELDLHRTFVLGPWGVFVDTNALWDRGDEFVVAGRRLCALSRSNRFLHACYHAALGDWPLRLASLRDLAEMLRVIGRDGESMIGRAREWGVEAVVAAAVADATRLLGITIRCPLATWAQQYVPTRRQEAQLALYTHPDKTFSAQAVATLRVLGWRDKAAYVRALVLPDPAYTAERHRSAFARFRYAAKEIRRGRAPRR
jgi:hypothetical protein